MPMISGKPPLPEEDDEIIADIGDSDIVHTDESANEVGPGNVDDEPGDELVTEEDNDDL